MISDIVAAGGNLSLGTFRRGTILSGIMVASPDTYLMIEVPMIECVAGRGIRGDRYFDFKNDYKGQITFFSLEVFDELCERCKSRTARPLFCGAT